MNKKFLLLTLAFIIFFTLAGCGVGVNDPWVVSTFSDYSGPGKGMAFDSTGNLYLADNVSRVIKITPEGTSSVFLNDATQLNIPRGIAVDAADNLYVCNDQPNHTIVKITPGGICSLYAGTTGSHGGSNTAPVTFYRPYGLALDRTSQILYVADCANSKIRKIDMTSEIISDFVNMAYPYSVAVDSAGYVYACSSISNVINKYTAAGALDNSYTLWDNPKTADCYAMTVDSAGNMLVADYTNHIIWKIDSDGHASVLAGTPGKSGMANGGASKAKFLNPCGIAVDSQDRVYVIDNNHVIRRIALK